MKKVLVVEDDIDNAYVIELVLEGVGYEVHYSDTKVPLEEIVTLSPCLIVLDHWNGSFLGGDYCKEIKEFPDTEKIPVLIISASSNLDKIAVEACADDYIEKPFDLSALEEKVKKLCWCKKTGA